MTVIEGQIDLAGNFGRTDLEGGIGDNPESLMTDITGSLTTGSESELKALAAQYPVLVISKTTCAFSVELKRTLGMYYLFLHINHKYHK
jgi:hypothetical protein